MTGLPHVSRDRWLLQRLESFVRCQCGPSSEWLEEDFTWLPGFLELAQRPAFASFRWVCMRGAAGSRMLGIRPSIAEPAFRLASLESEGFSVYSIHPVGMPIADATGCRFLIAELLSAHDVRLLECAYLSPSTWHVLDEHVLRRRA